MPRPIDLLKQEREEDLWRMCCGFINLSLEQFMIIQKRLLVEQIGLLKGCELGRKMMRGAMPETVEEFREQVPLTTYTDYLPELEERKEEILPAKPAYGCIQQVGLLSITSKGCLSPRDSYMNLRKRLLVSGFSPLVTLKVIFWRKNI